MEEAFKWSRDDIKHLLSLIAKHDQKFEVMQKNKIWREIAGKISEALGKEISAERCCGKWKGFRITYKRIKMSGNNSRNWEYFETMDAILGSKPEFQHPKSRQSGKLNLDTTYFGRDEENTMTSELPDNISEESFGGKDEPSIQNDADQQMLKEGTEILTFSDDSFEDTQIYGKAWAAQFRQLSELQKTFAQRVIEETLFQGRMGKLTNQSSNNLTSITNQPDNISEESFHDKNVLWIEKIEEEADDDQQMLEEETETMTFPNDTVEDSQIYGKAWAAQYRKLSPSQKLFAKRVIEEALFQGRMEKLTNESSNHMTSQSNPSSAIRKIVPMLDRILVQRAEALTTTKGGIMLPEKAAGKVLQGTVVAVGPGSRNSTSGSHIPIGVKEGDRVLLPEFGGTKVEMEDKKEYILFRESDILAKLE